MEYSRDDEEEYDEEIEEDKSRRNNWSTSETNYFIQLLEEYKESLFSVEAQVAHFSLRNEVWSEIATRMMEIGLQSTNKQCRKKFENMTRSFLKSKQKSVKLIKTAAGKRKILTTSIRWPFFKAFMPLMKYVTENKHSSGDNRKGYVYEAKKILSEEGMDLDDGNNMGNIEVVNQQVQDEPGPPSQNMEEFYRNQAEDSSAANSSDSALKGKQDHGIVGDLSEIPATKEFAPKIKKSFSFASMNRRLSGRNVKPSKKMRDNAELQRKLRRSRSRSPAVSTSRFPSSGSRSSTFSRQNERRSRDMSNSSSDRPKKLISESSFDEILVDEIQGVRQEVRNINRNLEKMIDVHSRLNDNLERFLSAMRFRLQ